MICRTLKLTDICEIERARLNKIYPAGTCYIQVSACTKNSVEKWHITKEDGTIEGKYAAIIPKVPCIPEYLLEALERYSDEFFEKYIGSNINIQMELFRYYILPFHFDLTEQKQVLDVLLPIKEDIQLVEEQIDKWQSLKNYFLEGMMAKL